MSTISEYRKTLQDAKRQREKPFLNGRWRKIKPVPPEEKLRLGDSVKFKALGVRGVIVEGIESIEGSVVYWVQVGSRQTFPTYAHELELLKKAKPKFTIRKNYEEANGELPSKTPSDGGRLKRKLPAALGLRTQERKAGASTPEPSASNGGGGGRGKKKRLVFGSKPKLVFK